MGPFRVKARAKPKGPRASPSSSSANMDNDSISMSSGSSGMSAFRDAFDDLVRESILVPPDECQLDSSQDNLDWIDERLRQMEADAEASIENRSPPPPPRKTWPPPETEDVKLPALETAEKTLHDEKACAKEEAYESRAEETSKEAEVQEPCETSAAGTATAVEVREAATDAEASNRVSSNEEEPVSASSETHEPTEEHISAQESSTPTEEQQPCKWSLFSRRSSDTKTSKDLAQQISQGLLEAGKQATFGQEDAMEQDNKDEDGTQHAGIIKDSENEDGTQHADIVKDDENGTQHTDQNEAKVFSSEDHDHPDHSVKKDLEENRKMPAQVDHKDAEETEISSAQEEVHKSKEKADDDDVKMNYMKNPSDNNANLRALLQLAQTGESGFLTNDSDSMTMSNSSSAVPFMDAAAASNQVVLAFSKLGIAHGPLLGDRDSPRSVVKDKLISHPGSVKRMVQLFESGQISHEEYHSLQQKMNATDEDAGVGKKKSKDFAVSALALDRTPSPVRAAVQQFEQRGTAFDKNTDDEAVPVAAASKTDSPRDRTPSPVRTAICRFESHEKTRVATVTPSPKTHPTAVASPPMRDAIHKFNLLQTKPGLENFMTPQPHDILEQKPWRKLSKMTVATNPPALGRPAEAPSRSVDHGDVGPTPVKVKRVDRSPVTKKESTVKAAAICELKVQKRRQEGEFFKKCRSEFIVSDRQPEEDPALQRFLTLALQDSQEKRDKLKALKEGMAVGSGVAGNSLARSSLKDPSSSKQLSISDHPRSHGRVNLHELFEWNQFYQTGIVDLRTKESFDTSSSPKGEENRTAKSEHYRKKEKEDELGDKNAREERRRSGSKRKKKKKPRRIVDGTLPDKSRKGEARKTSRSLTVAAMRAESGHRSMASHVDSELRSKQPKSPLPLADVGVSSKTKHSISQVEETVGNIKRANVENGMGSSKHSRRRIKGLVDEMKATNGDETARSMPRRGKRAKTPLAGNAPRSRARPPKANITELADEIKRTDAKYSMRSTKHSRAKIMESIDEFMRAGSDKASDSNSSHEKKHKTKNERVSKSKHSRDVIKGFVGEIQRRERRKQPRSLANEGLGSNTTHERRSRNALAFDDDSSLRSHSTHERSRTVGLSGFLEQNQAKATEMSMQDFIERSVANVYAERRKRSNKSTRSVAGSVASHSMNTFTERYQALQRGQLRNIDPTLERSIFSPTIREEGRLGERSKGKSLRPALHL